MRCPFCQNKDTQVIDSRAPEEGAVIRRRRRCPACGKRFTTFERAQLTMPVIVKRGGVREEYNRDKLRGSMSLALRKRPVSQDKIDDAVDAIEQAMILTGEREIRASRLGELVLEALQRLDIIAYIRFTSVYFNINDPQAFITMIQNAIAGATDAASADSKPKERA
jgi:transcriptional repressor NrdR